MLGNYLNAIAIIFGSICGLLLRRGLNERFKDIIMQAIGLSVLFLGAAGALKGLIDPAAGPVLFIVSLAIGGVIGEKIGIEQGLAKVGLLIQNRAISEDKSFAQGFVTASIIFCVGTMAIIGSIESGLRGDYNILFAKAVLDGIIALILASSLGIGVLFSAAPVFIYQGAIILLAGTLEPYLSGPVILEISIIGGILIAGIGLNLLEIKSIKTANLLPAVLIPVIYYLWIEPLVNMIR